MACGGSCGCDDCASAPTRVRRDAACARCLVAPDSVATTPAHPSLAMRASGRRRVPARAEPPRADGRTLHEERLARARDRIGEREKARRAEATPPLFAAPLDDAVYVAPPGSPPRLPEREVPAPKPAARPSASAAEAAASNEVPRNGYRYQRLLPGLFPGGHGKSGSDSSPSGPDSLHNFGSGDISPLPGSGAPAPACSCDCECREPDVRSKWPFQLPFLSPPQFTSFMISNGAVGGSDTPAVTGPVEATSNLLAKEDVGVGGVTPVTKGNVGQQFAQTPIGRALQPADGSTDSGVDGRHVAGGGVWLGGSRPQSPPSTSVTAPPSPGQSSAPRAPTDPIAGYPTGAYVNPRPFASPPPTLGGFVATSAGGSSIDRGAGRGALVNVRPDFGLDAADGAPATPETGGGIGGGDLGAGKWRDGPIDHRQPPYVTPPSGLIDPPSKGSAQNRISDEQSRGLLAPPSGGPPATPPSPPAGRPGGLHAAGTVSRALFPPMFPGPGDRFQIPGNSLATIGPQRADVLLEPTRGQRLAAAGSRRTGTSRVAAPLGGGATGRISVAAPDSLLVEAPLLKSWTSEQDASTKLSAERNATQYAPSATPAIDGSIGAPTSAPRPVAAPPLHPALTASSPPPIVASNAVATRLPAPAPRTNVLVAPASIAGRGIGGATSVFRARPEASATAAAPAPAGTQYAPAPSFSSTLRSLHLGQAPEATVPTSATTSSPTARRTAAPEGSRGGPSIPPGAGGVPLLPEAPAQRGGGGKNTDGDAVGAAGAILRAERVHEETSQNLSSAKSYLDATSDARRGIQRQLDLAGGASPNEVAALESALSSAKSREADAAATVKAIQHERSVADAEAEEATKAARAADPDHADERIRDATRTARAKSERAERISRRAPSGSLVERETRASLAQDAAAAASQRRNEAKFAAVAHRKYGDGQKYTGWLAAQSALAAADDRVRRSQIEAADAEMADLRSQGYEHLTPAARGRLRALEATAGARRAERALLDRRAHERVDAVANTWAAQDKTAQQKKLALSDEDFAAWQARQDQAAEAQEGPLLAALESQEAAASAGDAPPLTATQKRDLQRLRDRAQTRASRAPSAADPEVQFSTAGCAGCDCAQECVPPARCVCTPRAPAQPDGPKPTITITVIPEHSREDEESIAPNAKKSGGGGKAPIPTEGQAEGAGGGVDASARKRDARLVVEDLLEAAKSALSSHPELTAEEKSGLVNGVLKELEKQLGLGSGGAPDSAELRELLRRLEAFARAHTDYELALQEFLSVFAADFALQQWLGPKSEKPFPKAEREEILRQIYARREQLQKRMSELQSRLDELQVAAQQAEDNLDPSAKQRRELERRREEAWANTPTGLLFLEGLRDVAAGFANKIVPFVKFEALLPDDSALNAGGALGNAVNLLMLPGALKQAGKFLIGTVKRLVTLAVKGAKAVARNVTELAATIRESRALSGRLGTGAGVGGVDAGKAGLTHLTTPGRKALIDAEQFVRGTPGKGLYAFEGAPPDSAFLRIASGVGPSKSAPVLIPEGVAGAFHKPLPIGPWNVIRRLAGVRVAPGSVDLATGKFISFATGRLSWLTRTSEWQFVAADLAIDYTAYKLYKATQGK